MVKKTVKRRVIKPKMYKHVINFSMPAWDYQHAIIDLRMFANGADIGGKIIKITRKQKDNQMIGQLTVLSEISRKDTIKDLILTTNCSDCPEYLEYLKVW